MSRPLVRAVFAVLVVAPLSGHHATLLRDTVRTMLTIRQVKKLGLVEV